MQEPMSIPNGHIILKDRSIISIKGLNVKDFLQGLITQDMDLLQKAPAIYAFFLNQLGRYVCDVFVINNHDGFMLDVPSDLVEVWVKKLNMYRLRRPIMIEWMKDLCVVAGHNFSDSEKTSLCCFKDPRAELLGFRRIVSNKDQNPIHESSRAVAFETYYNMLTNLGIPRHGHELIPEKTIPLEANLEYLNGVSFEKGCYVGQELTSRTHHLGQIRKLYLPFMWENPLETFDNIAMGEEITFEGEKVGTLTSITPHGGMGRITLDAVEKSHINKNPMFVKGAPIRFNLLRAK